MSQVFTPHPLAARHGLPPSSEGGGSDNNRKICYYFSSATLESTLNYKFITKSFDPCS